ncbi:PulJ/GspJ family protein [Cerasicoccus arenae]|uniref:Prepilin-type N-terminal cleavage/methylation domain-containing protein n=1 Tax=Cerasicoccus arenae TaxID=424488 RepID=A0A8J3GE17_9BACT|nr:prepilin-type N-terminal cleavage/methylation domain-containing protein [Cerasicoccus arenae]MBK1857222.1 prepilin-type N-terminal cleavage/methylation domain-containing protein [Cerasicoccus arenae]GHC00093.1 hypothetical protein GCM10007047_15420 [Cerasicoccus arenae]
MKHSKIARGFTLIEVLAATAIMSVVILVVLSLTTNVLSVWNRSTGKLNSNYEARVALDLLANDFETMVLRNRPFCWVKVDYNKPDEKDLSDYTGALPAMPEMYFMARVEDRPRYTSSNTPIYGDICAVSYRVLYQNPVDPDDEAFPLFGLYRFVIDSQHTFNDVMSPDNTGSADDLRSLMNESKYWNEAGIEVAVNADGIEKVIGKSENFLSANVVDLDIVFWYYNSVTNAPRAITSNGEADGDPLSFTYTDRLNVPDAPTAIGPLEYVDIAITVMSPEGLAIVESQSTDATEWNELVAQYGTTFSRRIQIMAKPL